AGPDAIARCHAHPRNSDARRTPAHRPTPVPIALTRTAVMMPTWAPIHHPSALPTVAPTSPMSRVTCYLLEKSGRTLVRSRTLFSRLAVVTIRLPKGDCVGTRAVGLEVREAFHRLRNARPMADRYPPQREVMIGEALEPLAAVPHDVGVGAAKHERLQRGQVSPHRQVDHDAIVVVGADGSRVAVLRLQSPDESRTPVGQRVDSNELGHEVGHHRLVHGTERAADVDLSQLEAGACHLCLSGIGCSVGWQVHQEAASWI